jgi:hypothetical protein
MKKTLILILSLLFISTTSIYNSYGEQFWYYPYKMSGYKHPMTDKNNKLFEGHTNDVICVDTDNKVIIIYGRNTIDKFFIKYVEVKDDESKRIDFYTKDNHYNQNVRVTSHIVNNEKKFIIAFSFPNGVVIYYNTLKE